MFTRRAAQETADFDAGVGVQSTLPTSLAPNEGHQQQQDVGSAIAAVRQLARDRSNELATTNSADRFRAGQLTPLRTRVQQPASISHPQQQTTPLQPKAGIDVTPVASHAEQQFSVLSNPLCSQDTADPAAATRMRQPATLDNVAAAEAQESSLQEQQAAEITTLDTSPESKNHRLQAEAAAAIDSPVKHANKSIHFEVTPAPDQDSHDQQLLEAEHVQSDEAPQQQYIYDQDTGQLVRTGEGADTTRLARHYLEDWNTGEFFQLTKPSSGCSCFAWLRRKPTTGPSSWGTAAQEPSMLRSLAEFTDTMGSGMAAVGMFAQGLAGGLALLSLFMTYLQYATAGMDGFLAYYSIHAQMVNRAFFTVISLSLVSAASRLAYDKLGGYQPTTLKLRLVDGLALFLYVLAYLCNLIATPIDDQLTFEARRDLTYYVLPLQSSFRYKVNTWQVLNLMRIICCGLAWALVCYRGNPYVMMLIFEARKQREAEEASGAGVQNTVTALPLGRLASMDLRQAVGQVNHGDAAQHVRFEQHGHNTWVH